MTNIVHEVWKILDSKPYIRRAMKKGLINTTALARYLLTEEKIEGSLDAITSAIRRYNINRYDEIFLTAHKIISLGELSTKSKIAHISLTKDEEVQQNLPKLFPIIQYNRGDILRIFQANESIKIILNMKNLEKIKKVFPENKIIEIQENLAEINMHLHKNALNTPGIVAIVANELAINSINMIECMSCLPEMFIFVKEEDLLTSYNVLYKLCS